MTSPQNLGTAAQMRQTVPAPPQAQPWSAKLGNFAGDNSNMLMMLGLSLLDKRQNNRVPFSQVGQSALAGSQLDKQRQSRNMTVDWLIRQKGLSEQDAQAAVANPVILSTLLAPKNAYNFFSAGDTAYAGNQTTGEANPIAGGTGRSTDDIREYNMAVTQGFQGSLQDWILSQKTAGALAAGGASVYGTPIYGEDAEGNTVLGVIGKDGTFKKLDTGGVTPTPGVSWQDFGTYRQPFDKGGQPAAAPVPIENYGAEFDKGRGGVEGKAVGEAGASFESINAKLPGLQEVVTKLDDLANKATYTAAGQLWDEVIRQTGQEPREASVARAEYQGTVRNVILPLLRDTFGAQFTQKEGEVLLATLGDPNMAPAEKQAALKAFIEQKLRDVGALATQSGRTFVPPEASGAPQAPSGTTSGGLRWSLEP